MALSDQLAITHMQVVMITRSRRALGNRAQHHHPLSWVKKSKYCASLSATGGSDATLIHNSPLSYSFLWGRSASASLFHYCGQHWPSQPEDLQRVLPSLNMGRHRYFIVNYEEVGQSLQQWREKSRENR